MHDVKSGKVRFKFINPYRW